MPRGSIVAVGLGRGGRWRISRWKTDLGQCSKREVSKTFSKLRYGLQIKGSSQGVECTCRWLVDCSYANMQGAAACIYTQGLHSDSWASTMRGRYYIWGSLLQL